jgi:Hsp70 protein
LQETIAALRRAVRGAGVEPDELAAVLLVGGSSRIPMVAEMVGAELGRPVAVDAEPKHVVALGAARAAGSSGRRPALVATTTRTADRPAGAPPVAPPVVEEPAVPAVEEPAAVVVEAPATGVARATETAPVETATMPVATAPLAEEAPPGGSGPDTPVATAADEPAAARRTRPRRRRPWIVAAVVVAVALVAGGLAVALGGGGGSSFDGFVSTCPSSGPAACITSVSYDGNRLVANFRTQAVGSARTSTGGAVASIFFLARVSQRQAGSVSSRSASWEAWGTKSPFTGTNAAGQSGFAAADVPTNATALCVLLGDEQGDVAAGTGNCAELPPKP